MCTGLVIASVGGLIIIFTSIFTIVDALIKAGFIRPPILHDFIHGIYPAYGEFPLYIILGVATGTATFFTGLVWAIIAFLNK
jgi:hypothetical protein